MDYPPFRVTAGKETPYECRFSKIIIGISPRHSDTADVKFLVNGRPVWVAVPLPALAAFRKRTGRALSDPEVIQIAALCLQETLQNEGIAEDRAVTPAAARTLELAEKLHSLAVG